ncbi:hypothetical protein HPB49_021463 [Dermacentor silvarum]|uniref:Uncharacterized protein n=1 Tax=Dermacentor silvarum TaxID=543639 RepID=A0ACB8D870_DERSI|nr:hypothetical protein HPB49_021463 [Dermacentor silvarum]
MLHVRKNWAPCTGMPKGEGERRTAVAAWIKRSFHRSPRPAYPSQEYAAGTCGSRLGPHRAHAPRHSRELADIRYVADKACSVVCATVHADCRSLRAPRASVSVMAGKLFKRTFPGMSVEASGVMLRSNSRQLSQIQSQAQVTARFDDREANIPLYLTKGSSPTLLDRNWIHALGVRLPE